ncbi:thiamine phosphate synthase [Pedobacter sp. UYEF25]
MNRARKTIMSGIYLIVDPAMEADTLLDRLKKSLTKEIAAVQIWDNFKNVHDVDAIIQKICSLCVQQKTPVLINNRWDYLKKVALDGVHFDEIPNNFEEISAQIDGKLIGLTCGNILEDVTWAANNDIDYISFCSMFPSASVNNCEIVTHETVNQAALIFNKPIFLAGGINPRNINQLEDLNCHGIAVISGIMNAENPIQATEEYLKYFKKLK